MTSVVSELSERPLQRAREAYQAEIDALIRATVEVAADSPTCDASMAQILQATGLSTTAFYRHFSSKEELWLAILRYGRELVLDRLLAALEQATTSDGAVAAWVDCLLDQARKPAAARRTRAYALARPRLLMQFPEDVRYSDQTLIAPLAAAMSASEPAHSPEDVQADAFLVFVLVQQFIAEHLLAGTTPPPLSVEHLHRVVLTIVHRDRRCG
jgi:AcrR family transcriptional regulator